MPEDSEKIYVLRQWIKWEAGWEDLFYALSPKELINAFNTLLLKNHEFEKFYNEYIKEQLEDRKSVSG
jgi:hypothetical protein